MGTRKHFAFSRTGRSREGAWIEIAPSMSDNGVGAGRSREGAWIEICAYVARYVTKKSLPRGSVD